MPKKTRQNIYIAPELKKRVDAFAQNVGISVSQLIGIVLSEYVDTRTQADTIKTLKGE